MTTKMTFGSDNFKNNVNYHFLMEKEIEKIKKSEKKPALLLHSCCAPCSSYVLSVLQKIFNITILFYNPNIYPEEEYVLRKTELIKLIDILNAEMLAKAKNNAFEDLVFHETEIILSDTPYNPEEFYEIVQEYKNSPEGSFRCYICYTLRLEKTAKFAKENNFDYFCSTLTVSPYKNAHWLNEVGNFMSEKYDIKYLFSDFKKNDGYKHSIELSEKYGLYRQHYCGCEYSLNASKNASKKAN